MVGGEGGDLRLKDSKVGYTLKASLPSKWCLTKALLYLGQNLAMWRMLSILAEKRPQRLGTLALYPLKVQDLPW